MIDAKCPNCNSEDVQLRLVVDPAYYGRTNERSTYLCRPCGTCFFAVAPERRENERVYTNTIQVSDELASMFRSTDLLNSAVEKVADKLRERLAEMGCLPGTYSIEMVYDRDPVTMMYNITAVARVVKLRPAEYIKTEVTLSGFGNEKETEKMAAKFMSTEIAEPEHFMGKPMRIKRNIILEVE